MRPHSGCAIGVYRANAIGAVRYPSSIAHHAARYRYQKRTCRSRCQKMLIFRSPEIRLPIIQAGNTRNAQNVTAPPNANKTRLIHFLRVPGIFCAMPTQHIKTDLARPPRHIGCRWTNILAVLNMRFYIFSILGFSPAPSAALAIWIWMNHLLV